ncbi:unnamed protein product [Kuraishia capsulata CBS 1993]|uniref:Methyltransferase type 11 domain-containing protein n=1 Tax=Kuraishia capsulata CBS 1993 TaxID=1382522 RepID=W6MWM3_9ASCO|nr:uncharacterized protein KUCA_T00003634001 [Kuraishia capsulata CBS 1993]CDK27655.1 unnamed protein product [Kuraishia capsulata CBS 1993]
MSSSDANNPRFTHTRIQHRLEPTVSGVASPDSANSLQSTSSEPMSRKGTTDVERRKGGFPIPLIGNLIDHTKSSADVAGLPKTESKKFGKSRHFPHPLRRKHRTDTAPVENAKPRHMFKTFTELASPAPGSRPEPRPSHDPYFTAENAVHLAARLRFFMKFREESELNDSINYANVRREMWLDWYKKFLRGVEVELAEVETALERESKYSKGGSSIQAVPHLTVDQQRSLAGKKRLMSMMNDLANSAVMTDFPVTNPTSGTTLPVQNQDQVSLIKFWHTQIYKKMTNSESLVLPITRHLIKLQRTSSQSGPYQQVPLEQIAVLSNQRILNKVQETDVKEDTNLLTSWEVCFDEKNFHTNSINISDRTSILYDEKNHGYLPGQELPKNPSFISTFFDTQDLTKEETEFFQRFSSFTTTGYTQLPLRNASQAAVLCQDFWLTVTKNEVLPALQEIHRVLKPGGVLQMPVFDFEVINEMKHENPDGSFSQEADPDELLAHLVWSEMVKIANEEGTETNMSRSIMKLMYDAGFSKVSYTMVTYPQVSTLSDVGSTTESHAATGLDKHFSFGSPASSSQKARSQETSPVYNRVNESPRSAAFGDRATKRQSSLGLSPTTPAPLRPLQPVRPSSLRTNSTEAVRESNADSATQGSFDGSTRTGSVLSTITSASSRTLDAETPAGEGHRSSTATGTSSNTAPTSISSAGYRDERMNSFFELFSNYIEMIVMFKFGVLNIDKLVSDVDGDPDKLRRRLALIRMFIGYKAHGINFLEKAREDSLAKKEKRPTKDFERGRARDDNPTHRIRNEGIAYFFIFVAKK